MAGGGRALLEYLGEVAGLPSWGVPPRSTDPVESVVDSSLRYLRDERGVAGRSVRNYLLVARQFLSFAVSVVGELDMAALSAAVVIEFVTDAPMVVKGFSWVQREGR